MSNLGQMLLIPSRGFPDPNFLGTSGLVFWMDATRESIADAAAVSQLTDWSGNGRHAVQETAARQPVFDIDGLNSKPTVTFDGGDGLVTAAVDLTGTQAVTAFLVLLATGAAGTQIICEFGPNVTDTTAFSFFRTSDQIEARINGDVGLARFVTTSTIITTAKTYSAVLDKSLATEEATAWIDGATAGTRPSDSNNTNTYGNRAFSIGARDAGGTIANGFVGSLSEVLVYNRALITAERQAIEAYLKAKWGTA